MFNELKRYYNQSKIYKITNDITNDIYVGSTTQHLVQRWGQHINDAYKPEYEDKPLYKLIREIGFKHFDIELIKYHPCISRKQLEDEESIYIRLYGNLNIRYNTNKEQKHKHKPPNQDYTFYEKLMKKYFNEIDPNSFEYDERDINNINIEIDDDEYNELKNITKTKKQKPKTTIELLRMIYFLLKHIFKDDVSSKRKSYRDEHNKSKTRNIVSLTQKQYRDENNKKINYNIVKVCSKNDFEKK